MVDIKFLITRPYHDPLMTYLFHWSEEIINIAELRHGTGCIIDIKKEDVVKENVESYLLKKNPDILFLNGHGSPDTVCGYDDNTILNISNCSLMKNKIIYARSCSSASVLGKNAVQNEDAKAFIGYRKPFSLVRSSSKVANPLEDWISEPILDASNQIPLSFSSFIVETRQI